METSLLARLLGATRTVMPLAPVNPAALSLPQLALGQTVRAQVTARLADGSFRVVIRDAPLKLALPSGTKAGDVVTLRLVAREPQLAFDIDRPLESAKPQLSGTGRLIGQILREPVEARPQQGRPVVAAPIVDAAKLREPLARAIQRSGLFYESHQARWIDGDYPLALLREEPQAAMARQGPIYEISALADDAPFAAPIELEPADVTDGTDAPDTRNPAHGRSESEARAQGKIPPQVAPKRTLLGASPDESIIEAPNATEAHAPNGNAVGLLHSDDPVQAKLARELLPIVRQQLEAIETRQIVWQGELWPGQFIRWQIADQESDAHGPEGEREWRTRFALRLPVLGEVDANLAIGARGVRVIVTAADSATADDLRAATPELAQALQAAGLRIAALEVRHRER